jgi:hypothetical protein
VGEEHLSYVEGKVNGGGKHRDQGIVLSLYLTRPVNNSLPTPDLDPPQAISQATFSQPHRLSRSCMSE